MEVDKSHEIRQNFDELKANNTGVEEGIIDMSVKHVLIDVNIDPNQISDKVVPLYAILKVDNSNKFEML